MPPEEYPVDGLAISSSHILDIRNTLEATLYLETAYACIRLGSINHTILALEAIERRGCELAYVIFNHHFDYDPEITADTLGFVQRYLRKHFPECTLLEMP